jgi:hypothetical protein
MSNASENKVISCPEVDLNYYVVVRNTLHGLDGVRLSTEVAGLTVSSGFLAAAIAAVQSINTYTIYGARVSLGLMVSAILNGLACITAYQFSKKIDMFNYFIGCSVDIALELERKMITENNHHLRLTAKFSDQTNAGKRGDKLFKLVIKTIGIFACLGALTTICISIYILFKG